MRHYFCTVLVPVAALTAQAIAIPASAADLSVPRAPVYTKASPVISQGYDWSGFYAGAHAGYDWGRAHVIDNGVLTENSVPMNGAIGGLLAGINWQSGSIVYGLEGDFGFPVCAGMADRHRRPHHHPHRRPQRQRRLRPRWPRPMHMMWT